MMIFTLPTLDKRTTMEFDPMRPKMLRYYEFYLPDKDHVQCFRRHAPEYAVAGWVSL